MLAARDGDLAAVRGHLRRDRRCLDRLFEDGVVGLRRREAALHQAAAWDRTGVVAFLLAKGAAVDVRDSDGPGAQSRRAAAAGGASDACGAEVGLRCILQHYDDQRGEFAKLLLAAKASVDVKDDRGWGPQPMSQPFWQQFFTGNHNNSCSSMWHVLMN